MDFPKAFFSRSLRFVAVALPVAAVLAACGGSGTSAPTPSAYATPAAATSSICIAANAQAQTATLPSTGGVTGTLAVPPLALQSGDCLHVAIASGADATLSLASSTSSSVRRSAASAASAASSTYGTAVYQLEYTAQHLANIVVPGATLNFGPSAVPDGSYVVTLATQGQATQTITVTASGGVITYTGRTTIIALMPGHQVLVSFYLATATPSPTPSPTATNAPTSSPTATPTATATASYAPSTPYPSSPPTHAPTPTPKPTASPTATPVPATCSATGEVWNFGSATQSCLGISPGNIPILSPLDDGGNTFSFTFSAPWNSFGQPNGGILFQATSNFSSITVTNGNTYPLRSFGPVAVEYISLYGPSINGNAGGPVTLTVQQTNSSLWSQSADSRCLLYYWDPQDHYWAGWIASQFITDPATISLTANIVDNPPQEIYAFTCGN